MSRQTIESSGVRRRFQLHIPPRHAGQRLPLVLAFHGFTETSRHLERMTGLDELADREGFVVAYPEGTGFPLRWHSHEDPAKSVLSRRDVTFVSDLIDHIGSQQAIDPSRIYLCGFSNGAGMALLAARTLGTRIAAIAGVGGAYTCPWELAKEPIPTLVIHGLADPIVPFGGSEQSRSGFPLPSIRPWVEEYARRNGCGTPSVSVAGAAETTTYPGGGRADVTLIAITGGGHTWPGRPAWPRWIVGETPATPDATALIWDFFRNHAR